MIALTPRQLEYLSFIARYISIHGYAPTYQDIAQNFGLTGLASVHNVLSAMEDRGAIRRTKGKRRSIEIVERHHPDQVRLDALCSRGVVSVYFRDGSQLNPGSLDFRVALDVALGK